MGGTETFTLNLARGLRERGVEVSFMGTCKYISELLKKDGFDVKKPYLPESPVSIGSILVFTLLLPYSLIRGFFLVRKIATEKNNHSAFGIRHSAFYCLSLTDKLLFTFFAHRKKINVVWGEHESLVDEKGDWRKWMRRNPFLPVIRLLSRYATVVTVSASLKKQFEELGFHNVTSIGNPLANAYLEKATQKELAFPRKVVIGTSSRLKPEKGIHAFLRLIPELNAKYDNLRFLICGDGPSKNEVKDFISAKNVTNITLLPHQKPEDMPKIYASMDIALFLANSPLETFGLAALEAMSQGIPTVITPWFGFIQGKSEEPFVIVDPSNIDEITSALDPLIRDEGQREVLGERQRAYVLEKFAPKKSMEAYLELFKQTPSVLRPLRTTSGAQSTFPREG